MKRVKKINKCQSFIKMLMEEHNKRGFGLTLPFLVGAYKTFIEQTDGNKQNIVFNTARAFVEIVDALEHGTVVHTAWICSKTKYLVFLPHDVAKSRGYCGLETRKNEYPMLSIAQSYISFKSEYTRSKIDAICFVPSGVFSRTKYDFFAEVSAIEKEKIDSAIKEMRKKYE